MKKVIYTAIFFEDMPDFVKKCYNNTPRLPHMTHKFAPKRDEVRKDLLGKEVTVQVLGVGDNKRNQAYLTKNDELGYGHITISWIDGSAPKESNDITNWTKFEKPFVIKGTYGFFDGKGISYTLE